MSTELNTDRLITDLKRIVHDSEELLRAMSDTVGDKAEHIRKRLSHVLEDAKSTCRHFEQETLTLAKEADRTIRSHPYESIGVALGVGLLLGVLVTKK